MRSEPSSEIFSLMSDRTSELEPRPGECRQTSAKCSLKHGPLDNISSKMSRSLSRGGCHGLLQLFSTISCADKLREVKEQRPPPPKL